MIERSEDEERIIAEGQHHRAHVLNYFGLAEMLGMTVGDMAERMTVAEYMCWIEYLRETGRVQSGGT